MAALNDFTFYNNRSLGGVDDPNDPRALANLQAIRQYDPNANYRPTYGSDGQLLGYTLDVDASKLPGTDGTGSLGGTSGHGSGADYMPRFSTVQPNMQLADPNAVTNSPTYGRITDNTNINQPSSLLDYLGPAAVAAFAFGIPYVASAMSGGALGGAGAAGAASGASSVVDAWDPAVMGDPSAYGLDPALVNQPLGSAESSLYGPDALDNPAGALNSGIQPPAPIVDNGTPARVTDVLRNGGIPGVSNIVQSGTELLAHPGHLLTTLGKFTGLLSGATGGGPGGGPGGGLLSPGGGGGGGTAEDAAAILRAFYAPKMNPLNDPRLRGR